MSFRAPLATVLCVFYGIAGSSGASVWPPPFPTCIVAIPSSATAVVAVLLVLCSFLVLPLFPFLVFVRWRVLVRFVLCSRIVLSGQLRGTVRRLADGSLRPTFSASVASCAMLPGISCSRFPPFFGFPCLPIGLPSVSRHAMHCLCV